MHPANLTVYLMYLNFNLILRISITQTDDTLKLRFQLAKTRKKKKKHYQQLTGNSEVVTMKYISAFFLARHCRSSK